MFLVIFGCSTLLNTYDLLAIKKLEKQIINGLIHKSKRLSENRWAHSEKIPVFYG